MKLTFHEQDGVIIRHFSGEVCFEDMMLSWEKLLDTYDNLQKYKGILTSFPNANIKHEDANLNVMTEFLSGYVDQLTDLKIAVLDNTPMTTSTIIASQKLKSLQIRPFATIEGALGWIYQ